MRNLTNTLAITSLALLSFACGSAQVAPEVAETGLFPAAAEAPGAALTPVSTAGRAPAAKPAATPAATSHGSSLRRFEIVDTQGFGRPVVAFTVVAPADWKLEGGVRWNPNYRCHSEMVTLQARLVSPDGKRAFELFPLYTTNWNDDRWANQVEMQTIANGGKGCPVAQPWTTEQFIGQVLVPGFRPGARVVNVQNNPEEARTTYNRLAAQLGPTMQQSGMRVDVDSARARLEYKDQEEWIVGSAVRMSMPTLSASASMQGRMETSYMRPTSSDRVYGFRAPKGQLDSNAALFERMVASVKTNPEWQQLLQRTQNNIHQINMKGARDRARITQKSNERIRQINQETYRITQDTNRSNNDSWERGNREFNEYIRGTETYVNPDTGEVTERDAGFGQVWDNPVYDDVYSNDPNFNPNIGNTGPGYTQLEVAP